MSNGSPMSPSVVPIGAMPVLPFTTEPEHQEWIIATPPQSYSALQSHFSVDSSAFQVDAESPAFIQHQHIHESPTKERLRDRSNDPARTTEFAIVPSRPPSRPTVSFGQISAYSYYSWATDELEQKSLALALDEQTERTCSRPRLYACVAILCLLNMLYGANVTSLAEALPTIAYDLNLPVVQSFWLVNAHLLASAVIQPLSMRLSAAISGNVMLSLSLTLWTAGSVISTLSKTTIILLLGRVITGLGAGTVGVLIPLLLRQFQSQKHAITERAVSLSFWMGTFIGTVVGGALARPFIWRYVFYINLPPCLLALVSFPFMLRLPPLDGYSWKNVLRLDWTGWALLSGSLVSSSLAISWAGTDYSWTALQTLVPLVTGVISFMGWLVRSIYVEDSILPIRILTEATGLATCLGTIIHGMIFVGLLYFTLFLHYLGGHFSPTVSALILSPYTLVLGVSLLSGGIATSHCHRWSLPLGWVIVATGIGLLQLVNADHIHTVTIPISLVVGMALGVLTGSMSTTMQSTATNDDETIHAAPLFVFFNTLGSTLGVAISSCVFLNRLRHAMESNSYLVGNADTYATDAVRMAYVTQHLPTDRPGLKANLLDSYLDALRWVWIVLCILAGFAFILSTFASSVKRSDDIDGQEKHDLHIY